MSSVSIFNFQNSLENVTIPFRCVILIANDEASVMNFVDSINRKRFKIEGYFVIGLKKSVNSSLKNLFKSFWKKNAYNVIILREINKKIIISSFQPFVKSCEDLKITRVGEFFNGSFLNKHTKVFANKFKNLNGCPIRVAVSKNQVPIMVVREQTDGSVILDGRDGKLHNTLAETLNYNSITIAVNEEYFLSNGSGRGPLQEILQGNADIAIGNWWLKLSRVNFFSIPQLLKWNDM